MLVLALDTATPAVTTGIVELLGDSSIVRAEQRTINPKAHGELLAPQIRAVAAEAGVALAELTAIVCGAGPGPFTGLRVGMVTAASLGHALSLPVYPVCSLDGVAADAKPAAGALLAVTDARRREVFWACYDTEGRRVAGPEVSRPDALRERLAELGASRAAGHGAALYADVLGLEVVTPAYPSARGLVDAASAALLAGSEPGPLTPLYLRRPDAVEPTAKKRTAQFRLDSAR